MFSFPAALSVIKDTRSSFDVIVRTSTTTEKRLTIDLQNMTDPYTLFEVNDVALIRSEHNIADALTKVKTKGILHDTITPKKLDYPIEQWIIRTKMEKFLFENEWGVSE